MQPRVLVVALWVLASGCNLYSSENCEETLEKTLHITEPADPPLQFRIDTCRVDSDACPPLCSLAMQRSGINGTPITCAVGFVDSASEVRIRVSFNVPNNNTNCGPIAVDDVAEGGSGVGQPK